MGAPSRSHCSASAGSGVPAQVPGSSATASPTRPVPESSGAAVRAGGTVSTGAEATVRRKRLVATPPEFSAVTTTSRPARSVSVEMRRTPVTGSTDTPSPATLKRSASLVKSVDAFTV